VVYDNLEEIIESFSLDALPAATHNQFPSSSDSSQIDANFIQQNKCSSETISRKLQVFNLSIQTTHVADNDLDQVILLNVHRYLNAGQKSYSAFVLGQGIYISRQRVHDSLLQGDPNSVMQRYKKAVKRSKYSVPGSNSVRHLNGYHKLI